MHKLFFAVFVSIITLTGYVTKSNGQDFITLSLPVSVIAEAVTATFPMDIDANSKTIQGDITIISISELKLTDQHLACRLHLTGSNLAFVTEIAGHEIKLKVGEVEIDFKTNAAIRFDSKQQTLYIKPMVEEVRGEQNNGNTDIGKALVALLNGREFPVSMKNLDPLIAETGSKTLIINTQIANIEAKPDTLQFSLIPTITAK